MIYYVMTSLVILLLSFIVGSVSIGLFKVDNKIISFSTPIGFFVLLSLLYPGYYFITMLQHDELLVTENFISYTLIIFVLVLILGCINYKSIWTQLKGAVKNYKLVIIFAVLTSIIFMLFMNTSFDYRNDDINYYGEYVPVRIYISDAHTLTYDYQSSFVLFSVMLQLCKQIFPSFAQNYLNLGYVYNVMGIVGIAIVTLGMVDIYNYIKDKLNNKWAKIVIFASVLAIFMSDYWIYSYPHFTGTLKITIISILLILLDRFEFNIKNSILISLLIGGFIGLNSSGFFISVILIYAYFIYAMVNNKAYYLRSLAIFALYPASFAVLYFPVLKLPVLALYVVFSLLVLVKFDLKIEEFLNKYKFGWIILVLVPLMIIGLTYGLNIPNEEVFTSVVTSRQFFDNINSFDMVHDFFKVTDIRYAIFNICFWVLVIVGIVLNYKGDNLPVFITFVVLVTFFNPFVYRFISMYMTGVAFYRITTIFYNPIVLVSLFLMIYNQKEKLLPLLLVLMIAMGISKVMLFDGSRLNDSDDYSKTYHTNNTEIQVINTLEQIHLGTYAEEKLDEEIRRNPFIHDDQLRVASQIYGAQLFINPKYSIYVGIDNLLEDRFAYTVIDDSEFEQVFARRIPGYDLPEVNYEKACSLAYNRKVDYVVLDAQYNWELQTGLWPCSYQVSEDIGTYRILKMDYAYWQENINLGYTQVYEEN